MVIASFLLAIYNRSNLLEIGYVLGLLRENLFIRSLAMTYVIMQKPFTQPLNGR